MTYNYRTKGVCSKEMHIELNDDHTIKSVEVIGGCNGNLQGISRLVEGMKAEDAIARMRGIRCGFKNTSCPDQLAIALGEALAQDKQEVVIFCPRGASHGQKMHKILQNAVSLSGQTALNCVYCLKISIQRTINAKHFAFACLTGELHGH